MSPSIRCCRNDSETPAIDPPHPCGMRRSSLDPPQASIQDAPGGATSRARQKCRRGDRTPSAHEMPPPKCSILEGPHTIGQRRGDSEGAVSRSLCYFCPLPFLCLPTMTCSAPLMYLTPPPMTSASALLQTSVLTRARRSSKEGDHTGGDSGTKTKLEFQPRTSLSERGIGLKEVLVAAGNFPYALAARHA